MAAQVNSTMIIGVSDGEVKCTCLGIVERHMSIIQAIGSEHFRPCYLCRLGPGTTLG
jgi:hypothetical protein